MSSPDSPEIEWDGFSPINGEAVTARVGFADCDFVITARCCYRVKPKVGYHGTQPVSETSGPAQSGAPKDNTPNLPSFSPESEET